MSTGGASRSQRGQRSPVAPSRRENRRAATFERLVAAAEDEFVRRGYAATTVEEITAAAGTTRATFYLHFPSKAAVAIEITMRAEQELQQLWEPLRMLPRRPSRAAVRRWIDGLVQAWGEVRDRTAMLARAAAVEPEVRIYRRSVDARQLERLVDALSHLPWPDADHARLEAMLLLGQLERFYQYNAQATHDFDVEWVIDLMTDAWWRALNRATG